jgi:hypothetical protein
MTAREGGRSARREFIADLQNARSASFVALNPISNGLTTGCARHLNCATVQYSPPPPAALGINPHRIEKMRPSCLPRVLGVP